MVHVINIYNSKKIMKTDRPGMEFKNFGEEIKMLSIQRLIIISLDIVFKWSNFRVDKFKN